MPTYEYICENCASKFEKFQNISDDPMVTCPQCQGKLKRLINGGSGFIMRGNKSTMRDCAGSCSFEEAGITCCGASNRCGESNCHGA